SLLEKDRAFSMRYIRLTQRKLQFLLRRIELLTTQNHQVRLIVWLLGQESEEIRFPGNREELAAHLGMSRAALFRELAQLDGAGLISTKGTLVRILSRQGLSDLLEAAGSPMPDPSPLV
ncbi:MAG: winged helix-turn-helix domain-containing protein, partial [Clostridia bacterium]|nr:winged helix-turn-helix domain-containing protein [Clostridia bacterium]